MNEHSTPPNLSTLDGRTGSTRFELSDDATSYTCVRIFGATPDRIYRAFTDPADLQIWFPSGAPAGSAMTVCESEPVEGGRYHYVMTVPEHGLMAWHGNYTGVDRPNRIDAEEWFVMGDGDPTGPPAVQSLTFDAIDSGLTEMTMKVKMPEPEDPDTFTEQAAAGLSSSLATMDKLVSAPSNQSEMNWTLEVVVVPVSDVDQSKAFYQERFGFHLDHDYDLGEGRRIVQLTPPGSGCSIAFGTGVVPEMPPGSVKGLQLVVSDVERADQILTERGVETSGVQVLGENPEPTAHPLDNVGMVFLADPDGNEWAIQQMSSRAVSDE